MISKKAIKEYFNKDLQDWNFVKNMPSEVLKQEVNQLVPGFSFKTEPRLHQLAHIYVGIYNDVFNLWSDVGLGKSKIVLDIILLKKKQNNDLKRVLLICPGEASFASWEDQIYEHSNYTCIGLFGSKEVRTKNLKQDKDIYIINYEGLFSLLSVEDTGKSRRKKTKKKPDDKAIQIFGEQFDCLVCDEIHMKVSDNNSLTFRILRKLSKYIKYRYALTATPFGKDPMKLWSQYLIIDQGETLGETLGIYQQAFFNAKPDYFSGIDYSFKTKLQRRFNVRVRNKSLRYILDEVKEVPLVIRDIIKVNWAGENIKYYERAATGLQESLRGKRDFKSIENSFIKLRQISSGFLGFKNEDQEKLQIQFDSNPKLDRLLELIESIPEDEKILVFNEFILSGNFIEERFKKHKIKYSRLYGGTKDKKGALRKFLDNKDCRVFLIQSASGGVGLNLQVAKYGIFYESPVSCIVRTQCEGRFTGARQIYPHAVIYDLVMKNSKDEDILDMIKEGKDIFEALIGVSI